MFAIYLLWIPLLTLANAAVPSNWVEYTPGTCNLVISSPHGGNIKPATISDRTNGCLQPDGVSCRWEKNCSPADTDTCGASTGKDTNTQEIAALVVKTLTDKYGCQPHFVRSNLHRVKLDPNRDIDEAAQGNPDAQDAWRQYHENFMTSAVNAARAANGKALVIDVHGQGHPEQWTELGYLLSGSQLNAGPKDLSRSSLRSLAIRTGLSASDLLLGPKSFGYLLSGRGYKVVPSPAYPSPGSGSYFNGGYNTDHYSSSDFGQVDGIQVEINSDIRMDAVRNQTFAVDLAGVIDQFRRIHGYV